jgi:hypothetical protein
MPVTAAVDRIGKSEWANPSTHNQLRVSQPNRQAAKFCNRSPHRLMTVSQGALQIVLPITELSSSRKVLESGPR